MSLVIDNVFIQQRKCRFTLVSACHHPCLYIWVHVTLVCFMLQGTYIYEKNSVCLNYNEISLEGSWLILKAIPKV